MMAFVTLLVSPANLAMQRKKDPGFMESVAVYDVAGGNWLVRRETEYTIA